MKKSSLLLFFTLILVLLTGCSKEVQSGEKIDSKTDMTDFKGQIYCTRNAELENADVSLTYTVTYKDNYILKIHSRERVKSDSSELLDTYEQSYNNIFKVYEDLKYYDNKVTRRNDEVVSDTIINYEKIDMNRLAEIEGKDNTIIKDGKLALKDWLAFAEKFGTKCHEV